MVVCPGLSKTEGELADWELRFALLSSRKRSALSWATRRANFYPEILQDCLERKAAKVQAVPGFVAVAIAHFGMHTHLGIGVTT
jgi:hypothetical protein